MEFGPNDNQRLFERLVRKFLGDRLPVDALHRLARSGAGFDEPLWKGLVEIGLAGVLVPERFGGAGLGMFEAGLAAEALGYFATPAPFAGAAVMAPIALLGTDSDAARATWLPRIADGTTRFAVGFERLAGTTGASAIDRRAGGVSGRVDGLIDAAGATHLLILLHDGTIVVLPADAAGVRLSVAPGLDRTRPVASVEFSDASADELPAADPLALALRVLDAGRVMLAADTLGAAQSMLDRALAYACQREQFGRLIGSFQAVKHACADMVTMLEPCRALVWYAAHVQDAMPDESRLAACHTKAHLAEVGCEVARLATELHGGMGFTDELGLHYWFKRVNASRHLLGGPERCRHEATMLEDAPR